MCPAPTKFPVAGDVIVFTLQRGHAQVLLVERKFAPFQGKLAFPGGFVDAGEELADAALRELREETGVSATPAIFSQLGAYGVSNRDPRGDTVSVVFIAIQTELGEVCAGDDAAAAVWHPVDAALQPGALAFDHTVILGDAVQRACELLRAQTTDVCALPAGFAAQLCEALQRGLETRHIR